MSLLRQLKVYLDYVECVIMSSGGLTPPPLIMFFFLFCITAIQSSPVIKEIHIQFIQCQVDSPQGFDLEFFLREVITLRTPLQRYWLIGWVKRIEGAVKVTSKLLSKKHTHLRKLQSTFNDQILGNCAASGLIGNQTLVKNLSCNLLQRQNLQLQPFLMRLGRRCRLLQELLTSLVYIMMWAQLAAVGVRQKKHKK